MRALLTEVADRRLDVLAFALPPGVERRDARVALAAELGRSGLFAGTETTDGHLSEPVVPMVAAIRDHLAG